MPAGCGTECGYRRHLNARQVPCRGCCDAHAVHVANWRARGSVNTPSINPLLYRAARLGHEPAEALDTADRARLVAELHRLGWTDVQIAAHTRMTTYTTARIRARIGLAPNSAATHRRTA